MKLERINENQIRCTLTKSDLEEHQVKLTELAFGTDHAKDLFRDMMEQASSELGFDAEDIPLMIEAVPLSTDQIVLIITKMDNPEDLENHFSKYMKPLGLNESIELDDSDETDDDELPEFMKESKHNPIGKLFQEAHRIATEKATRKADSEVSDPKDETHRIYRFSSLLTAIDAIEKIYPLYEGKSSLYKDADDNFYYLVLDIGNHSSEDFHQMCNVLSEFGLYIPFTEGIYAYFTEHFTTVISENAIDTLASLSEKTFV